MTAVSAGDVRRARAFLQSAGVPSNKVSPQHFARASKELSKSFRATLKYLNLLIAGGSGTQPSPIATADKNRLDPQEALGDMTPSQRMRYESANRDA